MMDFSVPVKTMAVGASAFLAADRVAKALPPTPMWALGWGALATAVSYAVIKKTSDPLAKAVGIGVAAAYLHAYAHQTDYKHNRVKK